MVQIFDMGPSRGALQAQILGQGLNSLGEGLGAFYNNYKANKDFEELENDPDLAKKPFSERLQAAQQVARKHGKLGEKIYQQRMEFEQQAQKEKEAKIVAKAREGKEISENEWNAVSPKNQFELSKIKQAKTMGKNVHDSLIAAGYPEDTASLWQQQVEGSTTGGLTDTIKQVNDLLRRTPSGKGMQGAQQEKQVLKPSIEIPGVDAEPLELDFPDLPEPIQMTSSDVIKQNEHREKTNTPVYTETVDRLNTLDEQYNDIKHLQELDENPDNLPSGLERWNVDWDTGRLRVKALATPEAQDYVKTIARMIRQAKEFFPGRVTNFEADKFLEGFATLANTREGRQLISKQLAMANRIAYLKDETLKAAYDHYGSNADPILVKKYATENYRKLKSKLENQLKDLNKQADSMRKSQSSESEKPSLDEIFK